MPAVNASFLTTPQPAGGSLLHEALYQLMREGLPVHPLQSRYHEDGVKPLRTRWVYGGVRMFGNPASGPARHRRVS